MNTNPLEEQAASSLATIQFTRVSPLMVEAARVTELSGRSVSVAFAFIIRVDDKDGAHVRSLGTHGARILRTMEMALHGIGIEKEEFWNEVTKTKSNKLSGLQAILLCKSKSIEGDKQSTPRIKNHLKIIKAN